MIDTELFYFLIFFGLMLIVLDIAVIGVTMIFPFGIGLIAFALSSLYLDFISSAAISIILTIVLFIWAYYFSRSQKVGSHMVIDIRGKKGKIISLTKDGDFYIARIGTEEWLADCDEKLKVGDQVLVNDIEGVKAMVKKV